MKIVNKIVLYSFVFLPVISQEPPNREFLINLLQQYKNAGILDVSAKSTRTKEDIKTWIDFTRKNQIARKRIADEVRINDDVLTDVLNIIEAELKPCAVTVQPKPQIVIPAAAQPVSKPAAQPVAAVAPKGMHNASANCFMISALQAMFSLDYLSGILLKNTAQVYHKNTMAYHYVTLLSAVKQTPGAQYDPSPFCVSARAIMKEQSVGDANEFLTVLLQSLVNESVKPNNEIRDLFAIETLKFIGGSRHSENVDYLLNIQNVNRNSLIACLDDYFSAEMVGNRIHQIRLLQTSRYFIVGIKRTGFDPASKTPVKIDTPIMFPVNNLDLNKFKVGKQALPYYQLKAIIMHEGPVNGGHYTAYVRAGHQWYFVDDAKIAPASSKQIEELSVTGKVGHVLPVTFFYEAN